MKQRIAVWGITAVIAVPTIGCSPVRFAGEAETTLSSPKDLASTDDSGDSDAAAPVVAADPDDPSAIAGPEPDDEEPALSPPPPLPAGPGELVCGYPVWTGPVNKPQESECHAVDRPNYAKATGNTYYFEMYNALNLTSGWVPESLGFPGDRYITFQNVDVAAGHAPGSIELILKSYEPVIWIIRGNTAAVKTVHVFGYHCSEVKGVSPTIVRSSIKELGQNSSESLSSLLSSRVIKKSVSYYEGSCLQDRAFKAD